MFLNRILQQGLKIKILELIGAIFEGRVDITWMKSEKKFKLKGKNITKPYFNCAIFESFVNIIFNRNTKSVIV